MVALPILLLGSAKYIQKTSNSCEKVQIPPKGLLIPKIAKISPSLGQNSEKDKFNLPKCRDNAQLTNKSS